MRRIVPCTLIEPNNLVYALPSDHVETFFDEGIVLDGDAHPLVDNIGARFQLRYMPAGVVSCLVRDANAP